MSRRSEKRAAKSLSYKKPLSAMMCVFMGSVFNFMLSNRFMGKKPRFHGQSKEDKEVILKKAQDKRDRKNAKRKLDLR